MGGMGTLFGFGHWDLILFDGKNASSLGRGIARFFISLGFYDGGFDGMGERIMAGFFNLVMDFHSLHHLTCLEPGIFCRDDGSLRGIFIDLIIDLPHF